eukprot:scaffold122179_cov27-Tisochrysis_lutea.AAC.5
MPMGAPLTSPAAFCSSASMWCTSMSASTGPPPYASPIPAFSAGCSSAVPPPTFCTHDPFGPSGAASLSLCSGLSS